MWLLIQNIFYRGKAKELSDETIKPPATSGNSLTPALSYFGTKTRVNFRGSCLKAR